MDAKRLALAPVALAAALVACSGSAPQTTEGQPKSQAQPKPDDGSAGRTGKSQEAHKADFMEQCTTGLPGANDYCECSWGQLIEMFGDDLDRAMQPDEVARFKRNVVNACADKVPEETVQAKFVERCNGGEPTRGDYCVCIYGEMRKTNSVGELSDPATILKPAFGEAQAKAIETCGSKLPEATVKHVFVKACTEKSQSEKYCECAWKVVRGKYSHVQIEGAKVDMDSVRPKLDSQCASLRPK